MLAQGSKPIIIIRRNKKGHGGHHGGAWKVAYADFVTAMMALFIVLWLLTASEQMQKAVGGYFSDPQGTAKDVGNGLKGAGSESLAIKKDDMPTLKQKLEDAIKNTAALQKIKEHVIFTITSEGLRVELLEGDNDTFFQSGSPRPTEFGKDLLEALAQEIGKLPNRVTMEGHTDSKPYRGENEYSNWELSSDRANAARRWMQENGLRADQVSQVRGFADQSLRDAANPTDGKNRRVTLIIQYTTSPSAPPPAPAASSSPPGALAAGTQKPGASAPAQKTGAPAAVQKTGAPAAAQNPSPPTPAQKTGAPTPPAASPAPAQKASAPAAKHS